MKDVDDRYGMVVGEVYGRFLNGDLITGAVTKAREVGGEWRIYPVVTDSFVKDGHDEPVLPDEVTITAVDDSMIHRYLQFNGVSVVLDDAGYFKMIDGIGEMELYNRFDVPFPPKGTHHWLIDDYEVNIADFNRLMDAILENGDNPDKWDGTYDVKGFLGLGPRGQLILLPIAFYRGETFDVNDDDEVNISDANYLIDIILGQ